MLPVAIACAVVALALLAGRQPAFAAEDAGKPAQPPSTAQTAPDARQNLPPVSPERATRIADRTPEVREQRRRHPNLTARDITLFGASGNWGIRYQDGSDATKLAEVTVDGHTGEVIEAWQGIQADWVMARGHDGYFGERFESWYIWLPLCVLFLFPFFDPRRPFRILHLDLLVLVGGFGISHFFFNKGEIGTSVPLVYPVLAYFLGRMLFAAFRPRRSAGPLVPIVPAAFLVVGIVLLVGLRIGLDLTSGRVGDVGYGSAVGAYRIQHDEPLYVDSGRNDLHFDTYGPVNYLAYDPFVRVLEPTEQQTPGVLGLRPAGRPRGRNRVRRAHPDRAVPARPTAEVRPRWAHARAGARLRLGELPLHAVPVDDERERHADLDVPRVRAAGSHVDPGTRGADRPRGCREVRPTCACAPVCDRAW